jgi:hypothetical protein
MPEGLRAEQALGGLIDAYLMGPDGNVNVVAVSNIGITLPPDIQPEDDWSQTLQIQASSQDGSLNGTITIEFEAMGEREITVPAGTFNAMAVSVEATATFSGGKGSSILEYKGTDWFAPGVGRILSIGEITGPFTSSYNLELNAYNIP